MLTDTHARNTGRQNTMTVGTKSSTTRTYTGANMYTCIHTDKGEIAHTIEGYIHTLTGDRNQNSYACSIATILQALTNISALWILP